MGYNAVESCTTLANYAKANLYDGVEIEYNDDYGL
jgi:hypothetical protein